MSEPAGLQSEIRTAVREFLVSEFLQGDDASGLIDTTPLMSSGILDSVAVFRLVIHLEERFDVSYGPEEITFKNFDTIAKMVEVIEEKVLRNRSESRRENETVEPT